jgi:competence protein ComEA
VRYFLKDKLLEYIKYNKQNFAKILIFIIVVLIGIFFFLKDNKSEEILIDNDFVSKEAIGLTEASIQQVKYIYVDISGAVNNPGVLKLEEDTRIYQAIEISGGLKAKADISGINMATKLKDENKVYIPEIGEKVVALANSNFQSIIGTDSNDKININAANNQELQELSGIGPSTADKIIKYREEHGNFLLIEDIMNVSGIGIKTFDKFKEKICI